MQSKQLQITSQNTRNVQKGRKLRKDNNSSKVTNSIFTKIWKLILKKRGKVNLQFQENQNKDLSSIKSSKKYFYLWMIKLQLLGTVIQQEALNFFIDQAKKLKQKNQSCKEKLIQIQLATEAFQLYVKGQEQEAIKCLYGKDRKQGFKQQSHMNKILKLIRCKNKNNKKIEQQIKYEYSANEQEISEEKDELEESFFYVKEENQIYYPQTYHVKNEYLQDAEYLELCLSYDFQI